MIAALQIHPKDTVAVALRPLTRGEIPEPLCFSLQEDILPGHKIALRNLAAGEQIIKYGSPIGHAIKDISQGALVHTGNMVSNLEGLLEYSYSPSYTEILPASEKAFFWGYLRPDGKTGIRNELWIVPTVGCVNAIAKQIQKEAEKLCPDAPDGIHALDAHNWEMIFSIRRRHFAV